MKKNRNSGNQQKEWQKTADAIFLLGWRKLLLAIVLWLLTAVLTWALFGVLNAFFSGLAGTDVVELVRESVTEDQTVGVATTLIFGLGMGPIQVTSIVTLRTAGAPS